MSDSIEKAARAAVEAADNTELTRQIVAMLAAQQLLNQQQLAPVAQQATQPLQPIKAHPWGAYLAGGCLGLIALTVVVVLIVFVVFGFAILAAVLGLVVVALTICVLVLKSMWTDSRKG